jgi:hypothetical protein
MVLQLCAQRYQGRGAYCSRDALELVCGKAHFSSVSGFQCARRRGPRHHLECTSFASGYPHKRAGGFVAHVRTNGRVRTVSGRRTAALPYGAKHIRINSATQGESSSVSNVPSQLEQRPSRAGARWTVSDRLHMTQYKRTVVRSARRSAARSSAGASSASAGSRCAPFRRPAFGAFSIVIMADGSQLLSRPGWSGATRMVRGPVNTMYALRSAGERASAHALARA